MKNPAPYLRQTINTLLKNAITYDGAAVPVYESEGSASDKVQIIIGEYSDADNSNKKTYGATARQVIQIVSQQPKTTRKIVDLVGEQVDDILMPTQTAEELSGDVWQVIMNGKSNVTYLDEVSGSGSKISRLILTYNLLIIKR